MANSILGCFKRFVIICAHCNHKNESQKPALKSLLMLLRGTFSKCKNCDRELVVQVPLNEPIVRYALRQLPVTEEKTFNKIHFLR